MKRRFLILKRELYLFLKVIEAMWKHRMHMDMATAWAIRTQVRKNILNHVRSSL